MDCKHETLVNERRQKCLDDTLIIMDCADCLTTIGVRHEPHTEDEHNEMEALKAMIRKGQE